MKASDGCGCRNRASHSCFHGRNDRHVFKQAVKPPEMGQHANSPKVNVWRTVASFHECSVIPYCAYIVLLLCFPNHRSAFSGVEWLLCYEVAYISVEILTWLECFESNWMSPRLWESDYFEPRHSFLPKLLGEIASSCDSHLWYHRENDKQGIAALNDATNRQVLLSIRCCLRSRNNLKVALMKVIMPITS